MEDFMDTNQELVPFTFREKTVRTIQIDGEPWFVAKDVCDILGIGNAREALRNFPENERMTVSNTDGHSGQRGGAQSLNIISESGLFRLISKSRKPETEAFRTKVYTEILPAIRKKGYYAVPALQEQIDKLSTKLLEHDTAIKNLTRFISPRQIQIGELEKYLFDTIVFTGDKRDYVEFHRLYDGHGSCVSKPIPGDAFASAVTFIYPQVKVRNRYGLEFICCRWKTGMDNKIFLT
jgi:prophage antirepressor-like protein